MKITKKHLEQLIESTVQKKLNEGHGGIQITQRHIVQVEFGPGHGSDYVDNIEDLAKKYGGRKSGDGHWSIDEGGFSTFVFKDGKSADRFAKTLATVL